ncbi:MAG: 2,3,4,5-tetrahydropyridine-2,6-dicarboxylate N-succinyltransferase, partial [Crocinitomicaceae bacterium]|nr:2,3,4,5-tetrahydropyridine-2,6-dicarboxylate N-succinyltransferase [Crocinitomicaceae bacterium]
MDIQSAKDIIEKVWEDRQLLGDTAFQNSIREVIEELDKGRLRVAEPVKGGVWKVNEWIKKAVVLYFPIQQMKVMEVGPFEF